MKKIIFISVLIILCVSVFSQEKIVPEKIIYKTTEGKIYVNRSLPLYFKISNSKLSNSPRKLLQTENTSEYANPMYLGKEGKNIIYSPWAVDTVSKETVMPHQNINFELYADGIAPATELHINRRAYKYKDSLYYPQDTKIWFTISDIVSGVQTCYYSVNQGAYEPYMHDTLIFEPNANYSIQYYSTDKVGNTEATQIYQFTIDANAPSTAVKVNGNHINNLLSGNCKIFLQTGDNKSGVSKIYYRIGHGDYKEYTSPISTSRFNDGRHQITFYSKDKVGNVENEQTYNFIIDKTPPKVMNEVLGDAVYIDGKRYTSGRSLIQFTVMDNRAGIKGVYYSYDQKNWIPYTKPFDPPEDNKNLKIFYYAEDSLGNVSADKMNNTLITKYTTSELDLESPTIKFSFSEPKIRVFDSVYISDNTQIYIKATDKQSGIKVINYQINNGNLMKFDNKFNINKHGICNITAFAHDKVNNIADKDTTVSIDTEGPEIYCVFSISSININNVPCYPPGTTLYLQARDEKCGISKILYEINNEVKQIYNTPIVLYKTGNYNIKITVYDKLGNENMKNISFQIE